MTVTTQKPPRTSKNRATDNTQARKQRVRYPVYRKGHPDRVALIYPTGGVVPNSGLTPQIEQQLAYIIDAMERGHPGPGDELFADVGGRRTRLDEIISIGRRECQVNQSARTLKELEKAKRRWEQALKSGRSIIPPDPANGWGSVP
jgi:hypothetical protein